MLDKNTDTFLISDTKLDDSFLSAQFKIEGFITPYRYDRNDKGGGFLLYIREDIPSRLLKSKSQCNVKSLSVEINLKKRKWFLNCSYNPHRKLISSHLDCLNCVIGEYSKTYDNFIFIEDFNVGIDENSKKNFCDINCLKSLIKEPTSFKNPDKPTCNDLILTNRFNLFQHSSTFETGLSDFHLLTVTEFKMGFQKLKPKVIVHRAYNNFDNVKFRYDIVTATSNVDHFGMYKSTIFNIINRHVPIKKKYICANEAPFMSKELYKAIMKRSRLRNNF